MQARQVEGQRALAALTPRMPLVSWSAQLQRSSIQIAHDAAVATAVSTSLLPSIAYPRASSWLAALYSTALAAFACTLGSGQMRPITLGACAHTSVLPVLVEGLVHKRAELQLSLRRAAPEADQNTMAPGPLGYLVLVEMMGLPHACWRWEGG